MHNKNTLQAIDPNLPFRTKWRHIIFGTDTLEGQRFDTLLILLIIASVISVMLDSVPEIKAQYGQALFYTEWAFTLLFTIHQVIQVLELNG